jgi:transcriptional regulator of met regulon
VHDWLVQQSPQTADRDTGRALISNLSSLGNEKTLAAVNELYAKTGSDQLLEGFLSSRPTGPLGDDAMALANQIKDPALRELIRSKVFLESNNQPTGGANP